MQEISGEDLLAQMVRVRHSAGGHNLTKISPLWALPIPLYNALRHHQRHLAVALAHGRSTTRSVLMGRSAARVHGMWVIGPGVNEPVELAAPNTQPPTKQKWAPGTVHRKLILSDSEVGERRCGNAVIRATTPLRTTIDIARLHGYREGLVAFDWLLARTSISRAEFSEYLASLGRLKGIGTARKCLRDAVTDAESPYESFARAILLTAGIQRVRTQVNVLGRLRVDIYVEPGVCVEVDGDSKYHDGRFGQRTADVIRDERAREKAIVNAGLRVVRVSPAELHRNPAQFVAAVRRAVAEQAVLADWRRGAA